MFMETRFQPVLYHSDFSVKGHRDQLSNIMIQKKKKKKIIKCPIASAELNGNYQTVPF